MSFFIRSRGKGIESKKSNSKKIKANGNVGDKKPSRKRDYEDIDSDEASVCSKSDVESDEILESVQEKRIRLAKLYLDEIEKKEQERAEDRDIDKDVINKRLQQELKEKSDKFRRNVADNYKGYSAVKTKILRCKEHNLAITCIVISACGNYIYSGSKDNSIVKWSISDGKKIKGVVGSRNPDLGGRGASVLCLAISSDGKFLASGGLSKCVYIWNPDTMELLHTFRKHMKSVTGLAFRKGTHQLFSASEDKSVKIWNLDEMSYVETLFGHQTPITSVDALSADRAITAGGGDNSIRIWKVVEESQLIFNGHKGSIESVRLVTEDHFVSCGMDGDLCLWGNMKKKPLCTVSLSHGVAGNGEPNWVVSITSLINTDLIASGSSDGFIKLWKCGENYRTLEAVMNVPFVGFVNCLSFTPDGNYLIAGIGQEHRLGRWWRIKEARNSIVIIPLLKN